MGTSENPVWLGEYVWEETSFDGSEPKTGPLPDEVLGMFRPQHCLLCNIKTANMHVAYAHYESKGHFKKVSHYMKFNFNAIGTLKSKEGKFEPVTCDVCNIELLTRMVYLQHYEGKQHAKNVKKKALNSSIHLFPVEKTTPVPVEPVAEPSEVEDLLKGLPPPPPLPKLGDYVCALCDVTTATRAQMEMHNNGARHLKNVAKLADGELREFYMRNGNCEPVESGAADPSSAATVSNATITGQPTTYAQNTGYPPMNQPMMPQYPQMPYGPYPYPMPYDYNTWCQMYGQQYAAYYSQYGQYPYGAYGQQYAGQQPYNQGQPQQQQQQPLQQQQQQQQQPLQQQQQQQPDQQQQPQQQQQYPQSTVAPGNVYSENQDPNAWLSNHDQYYAEAGNPPDGETSYPSNPQEENVDETVLDRTANEGVIDSTIFKKYSSNRRTGGTPLKDSNVRVSEMPDGYDAKPLTGLSRVNPDDEMKSEEKVTDVAVSNGVGTEDQMDKQSAAIAPSSTQHETQQLSADALDSNKTTTALKSPSVHCPDGEKESEPKISENSISTENQLNSVETVTILDKADESDEQPWRPSTPTIPLLGEIPAGIEISDHLVSDYDDLPSIATQDPFPFNQINSNEPPPPGCSVETSMPSKPEEQVTEKTAEPESQSYPTSSDNALPPPPPVPVSSYYPNTAGTAPESVAPYYSAPLNNAPPYYSAPSGNAPMPNYNYSPVVSAPPSNYSYPSSHYPLQAPNYSAPMAYMPATQDYTASAPTMSMPTNYSMPVAGVPAVSHHSAYASTTQAGSHFSAHAASISQTHNHPAPEEAKPAPKFSAPITKSSPAPPTEPPDESTPDPPPPEPTTPPSLPDADTSQENLTPDKSALAKPKLSSFFARAAVKMFKEKKNQQDIGPNSLPDEVKKSEEIVPQIKPKTMTSITIKATAPIGVSAPTPSTEPIIENSVMPSFGPTKEAGEPPSSATKSDSESASQNKSVERSKKKSRRKSHSRSRSSSRSSRRRRRRRSSSQSLSPDRSPRRHDDRRRYDDNRRYDDYRRYDDRRFGGYRGGYGYGRRGRGFNRYRGNFRNRNDWDRDSYSRFDRYQDERDEFGRERSWKQDERNKQRRSRRRRSRSRSSSASPPRVEDVGYWEMKTRAPTPPSPENEEPEPLPDTSAPEPCKEVEVEKFTTDESITPVAANPVIEKMKEKISFELDKDEVVLSKTQETSPDTSALDAKRDESPPGMNTDEEEREKREILEKVALIKRRLMETQDEDEKPRKMKKRKKDKAKKKKKRKKRSSSSSSVSSSDSSVSSTSSSSSSSSETSTSSEPKSKRLVDALMAQLSGESGETKLTSHRKQSKKSKKGSKRESSKKKKKKDKKRKKEEKKKKEEPESLSTYITSNGLYHCKYCNFTSVVGASFLEHLISEEHKLILKLIKNKVNQ